MADITTKFATEEILGVRIKESEQRRAQKARIKELGPFIVELDFGEDNILDLSALDTYLNLNFYSSSFINQTPQQRLDYIKRKIYLTVYNHLSKKYKSETPSHIKDALFEDASNEEVWKEYFRRSKGYGWHEKISKQVGVEAVIEEAVKNIYPVIRKIKKFEGSLQKK